MIKTVGNIINIALVIVTIYIASVQYRANHAPMLSVAEVKYKASHNKDSFYRVTVENRGNGICLDAFLLVKEVRRVKSGEKNNQFFLSKPTREIKHGESQEIYIPRDYWSMGGSKKVKFKVIYIDSFGRKYLASDLLKVVREDGGRDNKHIEKFAKKAKLLYVWRPTRWIYAYWRRKAIKQRNTALGKYEEEIKKENEQDDLFEKVYKEINN